MYRPFDLRYTYYTGRTRGFMCMPRPDIMRHMLAGENLALCVGRQGQAVGKNEWNLAFCTNTIDDLNMFYRGGNVMFPLYIYPKANRDDLFAAHEPRERRPNLNPALIEALTAAYGKPPIPEDILHYIYAVLYAPAYREKYADFLRTDFPRIPFTKDAKLFGKLSALGQRLTALHLLKSADLDTPSCRFEGEGDSRVEKGRKDGLRYDDGEKRVYINADQHFAPVHETVWTYHVGGYQVCEKWLKDRKERHLALDDIRTYCRIVTALGRTIELQAKIDTIYPEAEQDTISMAEQTKMDQA
jgi:predicted helicase